MQTYLRSLKGYFIALFIIAVFVIGISAAQSAGMITGTVFMDYNANGVRDTNEPGVAGLTVTAYQGILASTRGPELANVTDQVFLPIILGDGTGGPVTGMTDSTGGFKLMTMPGEYRLEVTGLPSYLFDGAAGLTTVVFVNDGDSNIDIGVNDPAQYSQSNPDVTTSIYINGLPNDEQPTNALVTFPYESTDVAPPPTTIAEKNEIGPTWGLAYQRETGLIYSAAFLKRHAGLNEDNPVTGTPIDNPLAAIYATDVRTQTSRLFVDLSTLGIDVGTVPSNADRGLPADPQSPNHDTAVYGQVGKVGIGDMDISGDGSTLWVTNLFQKSLHSIVINPDGTAGATTAHNIPTNQCNGTGAANDARPFAVKVYHGMVYVGVTCSAENTQQANDMHAYVYRLDGTAFAKVIDFALDYDRGYVWNVCPGEDGFYPWTSEWPVVCGTTPGGQNVVIYPQPLLSDIEFDDDGSLITGFMDRFGHQGGAFNYAPDSTDETFYTAHGGGDIRRACFVNGQYVVEGTDPSCPQHTEGGNIFEFYNGDYGLEDGKAHKETSNGGMTLLPGTRQVLLTANDPINAFSSGVLTLANIGQDWGDRVNAYEIYASPSNAGFGKAHGIGDLELIIDPAPLELGNRLWCDGSNGYALNGIQDPGEVVVGDGTVVSIECDTDGNPGNGYEASATTQTSAGNYLFIDNTGNVTIANGWPAAPWDSSVAIIPRNAQCRILIDPNQSGIVDSCGDGGPTIPNNGGSGQGSDMRDSDGQDNHDGSGNTGVTITTGGSGENDHTLDFGFIPPQEYDWGDLPNSYNTSDDNDGANHIITGLFLGACVDAEADGQPTNPATGDNIAISNSIVGVCSSSGDDEDGVTFISTGARPSGAPGWHDGPDGAQLQVEYPAATAGACLNAWIDWNRNGTFDLPEDYVIANDLLSGRSTVYSLTVPDGTFDGSDVGVVVNVYSRFRLTASCNNYVNADGSSASSSGDAVSGEVEDYLWKFSPTAVELFGISVNNNVTTVLLIAIVTILLLAGTGLLVARRRDT